MTGEVTTTARRRVTPTCLRCRNLMKAGHADATTKPEAIRESGFILRFPAPA
jgi:hypothetical protein